MLDNNQLIGFADDPGLQPRVSTTYDSGSGTYAIPSTAVTLKIQVMAGGGSAGGSWAATHTGGGGCGGYSEITRVVAGLTSVTYAVGAGGAKVGEANDGISGAGSSATMGGVTTSATGGAGTLRGTTAGGLGGVGTGGSTNLAGGDGAASGGKGGENLTFSGVGGRSGGSANNASDDSNRGYPASAGGGGGVNAAGLTCGGSGASGRIVFTPFS